MQAKLIAPSWLRIIIALLIAALIFIDKLFIAIHEMEVNRELIVDATEVINDLCDRANEIAGIAVEKTCDAINADACYWAERKAEELVGYLRFWQLVQDNLHDDEYSNWWN
jgi:hypothetical protein